MEKREKGLAWAHRLAMSAARPLMGRPSFCPFHPCLDGASLSIMAALVPCFLLPISKAAFFRRKRDWGLRSPFQSTGTLLFSSNKNLLFTSLKSQSSLINFLTCNYFTFRGRCSSHLTRLSVLLFTVFLYKCL